MQKPLHELSQKQLTIHDSYALVTGASSGIGREIAKLLAERGYNILAVSDQKEELDLLKTELESTFDIKVNVLCMDLSREGSTSGLINFCKEHNLNIEILVNCAGILVYGKHHETSDDRIDTLVGLHISCVIRLCRYFSEEMVMRQTGYILNVSSISAVMPYPTISLYGPSKAFIRHYSRAIRTELKPYGIGVTCLMPGAVNTRFYENTGFRIGKAAKTGIAKSPESVARSAVRALFRRKPVCIPGLMNKIIVRVLPLIPYFIINVIYRWKERSGKQD